MKLLFTFFLSLIGAATAFAQAPAIRWQKTYGGTGDESAKAVRPTADGGYVIAGFSYSTNGDVTSNRGGYDCWIVKVNSLGIIQWQKSLGGSASDDAFDIQQTADGGYVVAGYSNSIDGDVTGNHGGGDCWIVKLSSTGTIQWQKSLGGTGDETAYAIHQTTDGGYIVAGRAQVNSGDVTGTHGNIDYWVVKLTSTGTIQWQKSLGGRNEDGATAIQQTADGGYIVAGFTFSSDGDVSGNFGDLDYWIVKLTSTGSIQWQRSYGGSSDDRAYSIQQTSDGGYIVGGFSFSNNGDVSGNHGIEDCWILKLSSSGALQWQKSLGGTNSDGAFSIQQTSDGGYAVAGYSQSNDGNVTGNHGAYDYWVTKLTSTGTISWQKSLGGTGTDIARCIRPTLDGGFIVAGDSYSTDGDVTGAHGSGEYWLLKLGGNPVAVSNASSRSQAISMYPNPATTELRIQCNEVFKGIAVTDLAGRILHQSDSPAPVTEMTVPTATLPNGLYLVRLQTSTGTRTMKFQVQH